MGFFEKLKNGLFKTKNAIFGKIDSIFKHFRKVDEELFDELEELLISADIGVYVTDITSENSEFRMYDRIVSVNGQSISTAADYYAAIGALKIGDTVNISVIREGKQLNIMLTLQQ